MIRFNNSIPLADAERIIRQQANGASSRPTPNPEQPRGRAEAPLPLYPPLPAPTPYPVEVLGPVLGSAAAAISRKVQVPLAIAGQSVLAAASLVAQAHADVRLPFGQTRPLSLFLMTVAGSGDRKSTADTEALWPIRKREKSLRETFDAEISDWRIRQAAHAAQKRKVENDRGLELVDRENELRALGPEPEHPLHPLLTAPDPTVEGLARAWPLAPASLGVFSAEGGAFVGGHGMSPDHRLKTAATLSELWDGRGMRRMRAGDGLTILDGRRLSIHIMLQPDAAAGFMSDPMLRDQGMLSRLLIAAPESLAGTRLYRAPLPEDEAAVRAYGARLLSLLERPWPMEEGKRNQLKLPVLVSTAAAERLWFDFYNHVERQSGPGGSLESIRDFASKAAEHAARIAGVLSVVSGETNIGEEAMSGAVGLVEWYIAEAERLAGSSRMDPRLVRAASLLDWMRAQDDPIVHLRTIMRLGPSPIRIKARAEEAISVLVDHGWITSAGERPKAYRLNQEAGHVL